MDYSSENVAISLHRHLSERLRDAGYDLFWHASRERDSQTAGLAEPRDTVTVVPDFPAETTYIKRLTSGEPEGQAEHVILVPALTLRLPDGPTLVQRRGLGEVAFLKEREFFIDGFARSSAQQRRLLDLFHEWLQGAAPTELDIWDYDADEANPPTLEPAWVPEGRAQVNSQELHQENDAVRYYVSVQATLQYIE